MSESALFSVVIPAHNAARTLAQALDSVLIQHCQKFEIIVVDDGSTDATAETAQRTADSRVRVVTQEQRGVSAARNRGIGLARAPWVSFLDADDLWLPSYLAKMEVAIQADPTSGLLFTDAWIYDESVKRILRQTLMAHARPRGELPSNPSAFLTALLAGNFVFTSATASREALSLVGGYDTALSHAEDYDLWLRLAAANWRSTFIAGPLVLYRIGGVEPVPLEQSTRDGARRVARASSLPRTSQAGGEPGGYRSVEDRANDDEGRDARGRRPRNEDSFETRPRPCPAPQPGHGLPTFAS